MFKYKNYDLSEAIDGLMAWDSGCVDSGIKDDLLKENVGNYLKSLSNKDFRIEIGKLIRELYLTDEMLSQGYGPEDVKEFFTWLSDQFLIDIQFSPVKMLISPVNLHIGSLKQEFKMNGKCGTCGGQLVMPEVWTSIVPPKPQCAICPKPKKRQRANLQDLLALNTPENQHELIDFGPPVGNEII